MLYFGIANIQKAYWLQLTHISLRGDDSANLYVHPSFPALGCLSFILSNQDLYYLAFPNDHTMLQCLVYGVYVVGSAQTGIVVHDLFLLYCTRYGYIRPDVPDGQPNWTSGVHFAITIPICGSLSIPHLVYPIFSVAYFNDSGMRHPAFLCTSNPRLDERHFHARFTGCREFLLICERCLGLTSVTSWPRYNGRGQSWWRLEYTLLMSTTKDRKPPRVTCNRWTVWDLSATL